MLLSCTDWNEDFHPTHAKVKVGGFLDTIERHSMIARRILKDGNVVAPISIEETNQYPTVGFVVRGMLLPMTYYKYYVGLLWHKYLMMNPDLIEDLKIYTKFKDKGQYSEVSHAEILAKFMGFNAVKVKNRLSRKGKPGELLLQWCSPLIELLNKENVIIVEEERGITESINEVVAFFHCVDVPLQEQSDAFYREFCSSVYRQYRRAIHTEGQQLIGSFFVNRNNQGNLQRFLATYTKNYRNTRQRVGFLALEKTFDEVAFIGALSSLKNYAKARNLAVSLPYHLGCEQVDTEEWNKRYELVKFVFGDYYVTLHKKN